MWHNDDPRHTSHHDSARIHDDATAANRIVDFAGTTMQRTDGRRTASKHRETKFVDARHVSNKPIDDEPSDTAMLCLCTDDVTERRVHRPVPLRIDNNDIASL